MRKRLYRICGMGILAGTLSFVSALDALVDTCNGIYAEKTVSMKELPYAGASKALADMAAYADSSHPAYIKAELHKKMTACEEPGNGLTNEEERLLAQIGMAEAESEDAEGKAHVMLVVLNRVSSSKFPDSIEEVIYQEGQFSPVSNGRFDSAQPDGDCWVALEMIQNGWDESQGALYFESKSDSTWHEDNLKFLFKHGKHMFYTEWEE